MQSSPRSLEISTLIHHHTPLFCGVSAQRTSSTATLAHMQHPSAVDQTWRRPTPTEAMPARVKTGGISQIYLPFGETCRRLKTESQRVLNPCLGLEQVPKLKSRCPH